MYDDVVLNFPDAVIIFWDSDVSDQLVNVLNEESTIASYQEDCVAVFTTCQRASPRQLIAVAGYFHRNSNSGSSSGNSIVVVVVAVVVVLEVEVVVAVVMMEEVVAQV